MFLKKSVLRYRITSLAFIILTLQYVLFFYIDKGTLPRAIIYGIYLTGAILPFVFIEFKKSRLSMFRLAYFTIFIYLSLITLLNLNVDGGTLISNFLIYFQIFTAYFFSKYDIENLRKLLVPIAVLALVLLAYQLIFKGIDVSVALDKRGYQWTEIFFYNALFWAVIPFMIVSMILNKKLLLPLLYWGGAVILNLIFLKRFIIVDSLLLLLMIIFINSTKEKKIKENLRIILLMVIICMAVLYFKADTVTQLFEATSQRIESSSEDLLGLDRWVEANNYIESASFESLMFGTGFATPHYGLNKEAFALHIGWFNFILKGGFVLLILILISCLRAFSLALRFKSLPLKERFAVCYLLIYFFRLFYVNMHNLSPEMIVFFYSIITVMDYGEKMKPQGV